MPGEAVQRINLGFVNAYLLAAGAGYVLVDTGVGMQWDQLEAALRQAGALPDHLLLVIATHGDGDHTGNCGRLQRDYRVKIALHPGDAAMVATGQSLARQTRTLAGRLMMGLGKLFSRNARFDTFQPDLLLEDGQRLSAYGLAAKVLHTPGHTPGAIALLTDAGDLLVGDTFSKQGRVALAPFVHDFPALRASVNKLKALPARTVYPGHGRPFAFAELGKLQV